MTASPGDGEHAAREGYYPDPSIPGFVRYWNGSAWVPGTSRPAPARPAPADETGPVFLDQTSVTEALPEPPRPRARPEPLPERESQPVAEAADAAGWQADPAHQAGFGGPRDVRVSWGNREEDPHEHGPGTASARPTAVAAAERLPAQASAEGAGVLSARPPAAAPVERAPSPAPVPAPAPAPEPPAAPAAVRPTVPETAWPAAPGGGGPGSGLTSSWPEATEAAAAPRPPEAGIAAARRSPATPRPSSAPQAPVRGAGGATRVAPPAARDTVGPPAPASAAAPAPASAAAPAAAPASVSAAAPVPAPAATGAPAAPRGTDRTVFERMAQRAVRPAGLGRRLLARALDSLVYAGVAAGAAVPFVPAVTVHVEAKVQAARETGRATTVWLLDGTVCGYLALVLAAVLLFGVFYEALPTARWGRTPGKKLCGVRVLAVATLRPPTVGAALRRWLVCALLGLPGGLRCLGDRPRRQAWHDKAARTYVAR